MPPPHRTDHQGFERLEPPWPQTARGQSGVGPVIIAVPARSPVTHWPLLRGSGVERLFAQFFVWSGTHRRTHVYDCEYHPPSVRPEERNVESGEELETWTRRGLSFWSSGGLSKSVRSLWT